MPFKTSFHRISTITLSGVGSLAAAFQRNPELVNIFEMMPPVQRLNQLDQTLIGTTFCRQPSLSALGRGAIPNGECGLSRDETLPHQTSHFGFNTGKLPTDAPCSASLSGKPAGPKLKTNLPPLCFAFAMADAFIHPSGGLWQTRGIRQAVREMSRPAMCAVSKTARGHSIRWVQWLIVFPGRKSEPLAGPCRPRSPT